MNQSGYQVWSRQQIAQILDAVQTAQGALLAHIPTEQTAIYRAAQIETLTASAAGFGLKLESWRSERKNTKDLGGFLV